MLRRCLSLLILVPLRLRRILVLLGGMLGLLLLLLLLLDQAFMKVLVYVFSLNVLHTTPPLPRPSIRAIPIRVGSWPSGGNALAYET